MHPLISRHSEEIADICRRYGVRKLEVFGSAARGWDFDEGTSDADFLVEFEARSNLSALKQYFDLREAVSKAIGRPVDLIEPGAVRNPYFRRHLDEGREPVYGS